MTWKLNDSNWTRKKVLCLESGSKNQLLWDSFESLIFVVMDTSLVMHYLRGNYTADHRNVSNTISQILQYVDADLLQHYHWIMTTGCPNVFNKTCSWESFMTYWEHSNNPFIAKKLNMVMKTMIKEECNNFVIPLPERRLPDSHLTFSAQPCQGWKKGSTHFQCDQTAHQGCHPHQPHSFHQTRHGAWSHL